MSKQFVKAVKCSSCGMVDNKADTPFEEPTQPDGPCGSCGALEYVMAIVGD